ncbi:MAG TPA: outer membrane lipoprotein carrier protein LolA, partial [Nitrospira sp.]|nr:outer membrane lipoprotein carrier protein LolA [Nitrospira sp.]
MMRTGLLIAVLVVSAIPAAAQLVKPDEPAVDLQSLHEVQEVVKNIQSRYEKTKDLQASFTQKTRIEGFSTPVISTGHFYIKKPGKLRWDYIEPATEEIYVNKDDVKMYVPE